MVDQEVGERLKDIGGFHVSWVLHNLTAAMVLLVCGNDKNASKKDPTGDIFPCRISHQTVCPGSDTGRG